MSAALRPSLADDEPIYQGKIDLAVKNNSHTMAYDFIADACGPRKARVLEVGCGTGYFGEALRAAGHEVWGIELSRSAARIAASVLDHVFVGSVEEFLEAPKFRGQTFDFITFGDVLEHLADPAAVLRACRRRLAPGGAVVASIPNVAHLAVRLMLLEGRWEYSKLGILDETHLRFFTKASIADLFTATGFEIEAIGAVRLPPDGVGIPVDPQLLDSLGKRIVDDARDVFQYVTLARPANDEASIARNRRFLPGQGPKVLCLLPFLDWSLGDIRIKNPLREWTKHFGGEVRFLSIHDFRDQDVEWAEFVVMQRGTGPYVVDLIRRLQKSGRRVIFDIDDLLTDVPKFLVSHSHSQAEKPHLEQTLRRADAVTVTTARLAGQLRRYSDRVFIIPNCTATRALPPRHLERPDRAATLVVASSDTVRVDFIVPALKRLQEDPELRLRVVAIGPPGEFLASQGLKVERHGLMPYEQFSSFLAALPNAIGLIPLDESLFSGCKSAIKFVDYSLAGIPVVCSAVPPYGDLVVDEVTGILVPNTAEAWYAAAKALALSPDRRQFLAERAQTFCREHFSLRQAADEWQALFDRLQATASQPLTAFASAPRPALSVRQVMRLFLRPAAYRSGMRVLASEGFEGVRKRLRRLSGF